MSKFYSSVFLLSVAGWLLSPLLVTAAPAPVIEAASQPGVPADVVKALEARLARAERLLKNQNLLDMEMRIESLQRENQQLLGQLEEQGYELESLKKRQRELYLDVDRRLAVLETARAAAPLAVAPALGSELSPVSRGELATATIAAASVATAAAVSVPSASDPATVNAQVAATAATEAEKQAERDDYERAFNLLKEGRYDLAVAAFKTFVQIYPQGRYTDNAQYWLGEANYVQRHFKQALSEFEKVVNNFPDSPKRPDALLKMGYTYQELGDNDKARLSLNSVRMNYPDTTAARLAAKRLQEMQP